MDNLSNNNITIIGLTGKAGVGKDYIAKNYLLDSKTLLIAFGDLLKMELINNFDYDIERLYIEKDQESRQVLQTYANKICRLKDPLYFVKRTFNMIIIFSMKGYTRFIITDIRLKEEAEFIKNLNGTVIEIVNSDGHEERMKKEIWTDEMKKDITEQGIDKKFIDFVYENKIGKDPFELLEFISNL